MADNFHIGREQVQVTVVDDVIHVVSIACAKGDPGPPGTIEPWDSTVTYEEGAVVSFEGNLYVSLRSTLNDEPDVSPLDWQVVGSGSDLPDTPYRFLVTDENGVVSDTPWKWSESQIVVPIPGDPTVNIRGLSLEGMTNSTFGAVLLPAELGSGELFGLLATDLDGSKPVSFIVVNADTLQTRLQAGWLDGQNFAFDILADNSTVIFRVSDDGMLLGNPSIAVDELQDVLTDDDTKLPTSGAVYDAIDLYGGISFTDLLDSDSIVFSLVQPGSPTQKNYGLTTISGINSSTSSNRYLVSQTQVGVGQLEEGHMVLGSDTGSTNVSMIIYDDDNGMPGDLLAVSDILNITGYLEYKDFVFSGVNQIVFEAPQNVWYGFHNEANGFPFRWGQNNVGVSQSYSTSYNPVPDDPWNVGGNSPETRVGQIEGYMVLNEMKVTADVVAVDGGSA